MIPYVEREFRNLYKQIDALNRRVANSHMQGRVAEVDGPLIRIEFLPKDSRTGKTFLSPWVQFQESGADGVDGYSTHTPVVVGEPMRLLSPHGELGPQSIAIRDSYTDPNPRPTDKDDQLVIKYGKTEIRMDGEAIFLGVGDAALKITAEEVLTTVKTRLNNGTRKVHYVGGLDSANDAAVEGAEVFV